MTTVGSQDTTGPMTRDEMKDLACMGFSADLVMQSFCHTAAYPKPVDVKTHATLPSFISNRGGVALRPGDGVIHPRVAGRRGISHGPFGIKVLIFALFWVFVRHLRYPPAERYRPMLTRARRAWLQPRTAARRCRPSPADWAR